MSITVTCPCGKKLQSRDEHAGMRAKCPACGAVLLIPKPPQPPVTATPPVNAAPPAPAAPAAPPVKAEYPLFEGKRVADWLDLLRAGDPAQRRQATEVLAQLGPEAKAELPVFVERLQADHVLVRHWAIACLKQLGPAAAEAVEPLVARLSDEQALLREEAARALAVVVPGGDRFLPRLLKGLHEKKPEARRAAIECFRRDLRTAGISRRRFWMCSCGSVFEKEDLERHLRTLGESASGAALQGARKCKKCGKQFATADVFAGKHDVPDKYRAKLAARFGERIDLPDDLLADAPAEDVGYQIHAGPSGADTAESPPSNTPFSIQLPEPASDAEGYGIAAAQVHKPDPSKLQEVEPAQESLSPGAKVPTTGKYRCTACRKARMSDSRGGAGAAGISKGGESRQSVVKSFKAGKEFSECPNCGDLTEWELLPE
ncbi:MAG TPA: HEAT repeat domain-containing protein [Pirellulales bacterium]|nr:HEAT repeat domain-containing protein [Pirellulales bacterium]